MPKKNTKRKHWGSCDSSPIPIKTLFKRTYEKMVYAELSFLYLIMDIIWLDNKNIKVSQKKLLGFGFPRP